MTTMDELINYLITKQKYLETEISEETEQLNWSYLRGQKDMIKHIIVLINKFGLNGDQNG